MFSSLGVVQLVYAVLPGRQLVIDIIEWLCPLWSRFGDSGSPLSRGVWGPATMPLRDMMPPSCRGMEVWLMSLCVALLPKVGGH